MKIDLHQLSTTLPHHVLIQTLEKFLRLNVLNRHIDGISITTIVQLVQLVLNHQFCVYENNLYRQSIGGSNTSSLIIGLIDIYLFDLLHDLHLTLVDKEELFGRSFNHIIFTWNESLDTLHGLINQINEKNFQITQIPITFSIDHTVQYLDAVMNHHDGVLYTKVYHYTNFEPKALPYVYGTSPTQQIITLLRAAYIRAFLYCSNVIVFEAECMYIEYSFKLNNLSWDSIRQPLQDLLAEFYPSMNEDRTLILNENNYRIIRVRIRQAQQKQIKYHQRKRQQRQRKLARL